MDKILALMIPEPAMPMSPLEMRGVLMVMGQRGLQICSVLDSLSEVMDAVQINHLVLLYQNTRSI